MRRIALALLMSISAAVSAGAQLPGDSTIASVARAIGTLRQGDVIRVALVRAKWVGNFERASGDTLFFGTPGDIPMVIRFNAIDTLWRRGSATGRSALLGALALGLIGGVIAEAPGAAVGVGVGAVGGMLVGKRTRIWRRLHP